MQSVGFKRTAGSGDFVFGWLFISPVLNHHFPKAMFIFIHLIIIFDQQNNHLDRHSHLEIDGAMRTLLSFHHHEWIDCYSYVYVAHRWAKHDDMIPRKWINIYCSENSGSRVGHFNLRNVRRFWQRSVMTTVTITMPKRQHKLFTPLSPRPLCCLT